MLLVGAAGTVFAALGGGSVGASATAAGGAAAAHPAAFAAVFLPAAVVALAGSCVATRLRRVALRAGDAVAARRARRHAARGARVAGSRAGCDVGRTRRRGVGVRGDRRGRAGRLRRFSYGRAPGPPGGRRPTRDRRP